MRRASFATIANISLWETIRRSLATTFITLLPIVSLLLFGGATLKDFAFALFVGIASGAYSSIFVAAPLLDDAARSASREYRAADASDVGGIERRRRAARRAARPSRGVRAVVARGREPRPSRSRRRPRPTGAAQAPSVASRRPSASSGASGAGRGRMAAPDRSARDVVERLALAAVGAVALTAERDRRARRELARARRHAPRRGAQLLEDAVAPLARRRDAAWRAGGGGPRRRRSRSSGSSPASELEELELRLAQLEHRLRLRRGRRSRSRRSRRHSQR